MSPVYTPEVEVDFAPRTSCDSKEGKVNNLTSCSYDKGISYKCCPSFRTWIISTCVKMIVLVRNTEDNTSS